MPDELSEPIVYRSLSRRDVEPDGSFEMELDHMHPGSLIGAAPGVLSARVPIDPLRTGSIPMGDIELSLGVAITGWAFLSGVPLGEGDQVRATLPYTPSPWSLAARGYLWFGERCVVRDHTAAVDSEGRFTLRGLEPGFSYGLVGLKGRERFATPEFITSEPGGMFVAAPAEGIELHDGLLRLQFEVQHEGTVLRTPRLGAALSAEDPRNALTPTTRGLPVPTTGNRDGRIDALIDRQCSTIVAVSATGYEMKTIELDPRQYRDGDRVTVELSKGRENASLRMKFRSTGPLSFEGLSVVLWAYDSSFAAEFLGPLPVQDGEVLFEPIDPETLVVNIGFHVAQSVPYDALPFAVLASPAVDIEELRAGAELVKDLEVGIGGRIELSLIGCDPLLPAPSFEVVDDMGQTQDASLHRRDPRGHDTVREIDGDGPFSLGRAHAAGRYVVRQVSPAYTADEREVIVRAGEVTRLLFQLEPK